MLGNFTLNSFFWKMVKNLFLVRHAEAIKSGPGEKDFDRELTANGVHEASKIGRKLFEKGIKIDMLVSSNAIRSASTAQLIAEQIKFNTSQILFEKDVYEASVRSLLNLINETEDRIQQLMIVGHNPVMSYLTEYLTGGQIDGFPAGGVAAIELSGSWKEVTGSGGRMIFFEMPS